MTFASVAAVVFTYSQTQKSDQDNNLSVALCVVPVGLQTQGRAHLKRKCWQLGQRRVWSTSGRQAAGPPTPHHVPSRPRSRGGTGQDGTHSCRVSGAG